MGHLNDVLLPPSTNFGSTHRDGKVAAGVKGPQLLVRMARRLRENEAVLAAMLTTFRALQRLGLNISPNHYYWPIPDVATLERRHWPVRATPVGFDLRLDQQLEFLQAITDAFGPELRFSHVSDARGGYHYNNGFFEAVDAEIAYCFVRRYKPSRIIEVGGGYSTRIMAAALAANRERNHAIGELISIDPFPSRIPEHETIRVLAKPVQEMPLDFFESLGEGDILFLDSSHIVSVGSDVVWEYLEILPRLRPGVMVHIHDIFLPSDYPRDAVLRNLCFWSEQYLLQAFLTFNAHFEVLWGSSAMQICHPEVLQAAFPQWKDSYISMPASLRRFIPTQDGERVWPSSFWIRRV
jgi:hypothetical protein